MKSIVRTDVGRVRKQNEDSVYAADAQRLFAVADGMGGHRAGEVASSMAVEALRARLQARQPDLRLMRQAFEEANLRISCAAEKDERLQGMGTTMTALWQTERSVLIAHVGDSRVYLLRGGRLRQVTDDHSVVAELLRCGLITPQEARRHPYRNVITRSLGSAPTVEVDLLEREREPGDLWLLCTDGLSNMLTDREMEALLVSLSPQKAADALMQKALEAGGTDNITLILAWNDGEVIP